MSDFVPTKEQKEVINARGHALLVSAGAGSGKTTVLTKRLMAMIDPPDGTPGKDIDSFLIITFTKAAAGELRARISEEISKAISEETQKGNNTDRLKRLRRQSALTARAQIGTIHSFCSDILKEFGSSAGIRPGFRIIEDEKAEVMKAASLEAVLEKRYAAPSDYPGFISLADTVGGGRDDNRLAALVVTLFEKLQSQTYPEKWIEEQIGIYNSTWTDVLQSPWGKAIAEDVRCAADGCADEAEEFAKELDAAGEYCRKNAQIFDEMASSFKALSAALDTENGGSWEKASAFFPFQFDRISTAKKALYIDLYEAAKERKDALKSTMNDLGKPFARSGEKLLEELSAVAPSMTALLELVRDFSAEFAGRKRDASVVDFSDLEHFAAKILTKEDGGPSETGRTVSKRYTEIMVDEYQDVSIIQDALFNAVSKEGKNLFFVGDIKQSIYRFRQADPEIFGGKLGSFMLWPDNPPGEPELVPLTNNYRSRKSVLAACNCVFGNCMSKRLGDVDYTAEGQPLTFGAEYYPDFDTPVPELMVLQKSGEGDEGEEETRTGVAYEASAVADRIRALVEGPKHTMVSDHGEMRPARYSDITILLRSLKGVAEVYRTELEKKGIPVSSGSEGGLFESPEIIRLVSLLSIIDNPRKDVPLLTVLRSPSFGFRPDDLARIRAASHDSDLYTALCAAAGSDSLCRSFLERLGSYRSAAPELTVGQLVWKIICEEELMALCSAMPDGELHRSCLLRFVSLTAEYEESGYSGLHRFVTWLERQRRLTEQPSAAAGSGGGVTIMSMHKSKGLEFPIVFVCSLGRTFNETDLRKTVLIHPALGLGPKLTDLEKRIEYPTFMRSAIETRLRRELRSEEMRLLYVAMTRAKEQLYLTGEVADIEKFMEELQACTAFGKAFPEQLAGRRSPLYWLAQAALLAKDGELVLTRYSGEDYERYIAAKEDRGDYMPSDEEIAAMEAVLEENLSYRYPYPEAVALPSKLTATGLEKYAAADPESVQLLPPVPIANRFRLPDFTLKDLPVTGTEKGTATHLVLQQISLDKTGTEESIRSEIERLQSEGFIDARAASAVDPSAVMGFFASDIGKRVLAAEKVRREFSFSILSSAEELLGRGGDDSILLQGVVDCFFEEPDGIVIVDYKTDKVRTADEVRARAAHYSVQLETYASALTRICGRTVKECILYFLTPGIEYHIKHENL